MFETIVALATPPIKSALSIVRLSGDNCFFVVNKFFSKDLFKYTKNTIIHGEILDGDEVVDDVVLLLYKEPHSFTGENSVEIITHGSPLIFNKVIELSLKNGARMAERGEYTSRAFMHNKMDLIQAESVNDLINAESEESKKLALLSLKGKTSSLIEPIKKDFIDLLSNIEVNIDYPEYKDIEEINNEKIYQISKKNLEYIEKLIKNGKKGKIIKDGINVALVGKPNVGKSSILNALLGEDKAIVTDIKGTTRDIVEGKIIYKGIVINLYDTAGIHESKDLIENIGIQKSINKLKEADLVIFILDPLNYTDEDKLIKKEIGNKKCITVYNKKDLVNIKDDKGIYISALNNDINDLKKAMFSALELNNENFSSPSINNARELGILENVKNDILKLINMKDEPVDILGSIIKEIINKLLSITGEDCDFDIYKEIFSRFCVGK